MKTPGFNLKCDICWKTDFFGDGVDYLEFDWHNGIPGTKYDGFHLCSDCWDEQENTRDERAAQGIAELEMVPYASAVRDCLDNGEG